MGFGHRVYKNYDPRARLIKGICDKLLAKLHRLDPIFDIAQQLEEVAALRMNILSNENSIRTSTSIPV